MSFQSFSNCDDKADMVRTSGYCTATRVALSYISQLPPYLLRFISLGSGFSEITLATHADSFWHRLSRMAPFVHK